MAMDKHPIEPGIPPSLQLKEWKKTRPRMVYLPHSGSKEERRRQKQLDRAAARAADDEKGNRHDG